MPVVLLVQAPKRGGFMSHFGYGDMVFSFFSSISYNLEGLDNWGKRFPRLLLDLCDQGVVENEKLDELQEELNIISEELKRLDLSQAVYDIGDLSKGIPWDWWIPSNNKKPNLFQPWLTPRGGFSYFEVFAEYINLAKREKTSLLLIYPHETALYKDALWDKKEKGRAYWIKDMPK